MKRLLIGFFLVGFLLSCSDSHNTYNNPNLLNVNVFFKVNLSLPQYNPLNFPGNSIYIGGYGNGGVIITNTGAGYIAFDAADPNHPVENCSILHIQGIRGICQCQDHNTYNLFSGTPIDSLSAGQDLRYTMLPYRVFDDGNGVLTVRN